MGFGFMSLSCRVIPLGKAVPILSLHDSLKFLQGALSRTAPRSLLGIDIISVKKASHFCRACFNTVSTFSDLIPYYGVIYWTYITMTAVARCGSSLRKHEVSVYFWWTARSPRVFVLAGRVSQRLLEWFGHFPTKKNCQNLYYDQLTPNESNPAGQAESGVLTIEGDKSHDLSLNGATFILKLKR